MMPDAELEGLEVTWDDARVVGKGLGVLSEVSDGVAKFSVEETAGVKPGDVYAVIAAADNEQVQISRRLKTVCMVALVQEAAVSCRIWPGQSSLPVRPVTVGDGVVFLEHTYGTAPRPAEVHVLEVINGDDSIREHVTRALKAFASKIPSAQVTIRDVEGSSDPERQDFYHTAERVKYSGTPVIVVGVSRREVNGRQHVFVNLHRRGAGRGARMVAAPPDRGIDLGPVDELGASLDSFAGLVFAAVQIYRGQTSEALVLLKQLLSSPKLDGPMRWHARDQFAMRWLGLGNFQEALWLVSQDMAVANKAGNRDAYLNALGTAVRLFDHRNLKSRAVELSQEYLTARASEKPDAAYRSALGMHVEMLLGNDRVDDARQRVAELESLCPSGCEGDLVSMLSAAFWATPREAVEFQDELLAKITALSEARGGESLAALRIYQGLRAMGTGNLEEAVIAFLEAERLYEALSYPSGVARARYFRMMTEMARKEPNAALEAGAGAIDIQRELQDFADVAVIYERLATLYTSFDPAKEPGPYLSAAGEVLAEYVQSSLASGNMGKAAESLFTMASFLMRLGQLDESKMLLRRAVGYSITAARFDMTALCHLSLAHIAREQGDFEEFKGEVERPTDGRHRQRSRDSRSH
ncbi:MAG: hypothetical protein R3E66_08275 [bacterium]